jgi:dipeptidyl-peptidase-4
VGRVPALRRVELADIEDGLAWLRKQPWVDGDRIASTGWSLRRLHDELRADAHAELRDGDRGRIGDGLAELRLVYTERYMKTPEHNEDGYARTSVVAGRRTSTASCS